MKNRIFKKEWYQIDPLDKMVKNYNSKNRYSRRHPFPKLKLFDGEVFIKLR